MTKQKNRLLITLSLVLILLCAALLPSIETILINFPEILFGQVVLTRETKPLSPRAFQGAEFVLQLVEISEIERAVYIAVYDDVLFWGPQYVGFPRAELSEDEIHALHQFLSAGNIFYQMPDGDAYQCVTQRSPQEPKLEPCVDGRRWMDQYLSSKWDAEQNHSVGVLQFFLSDHRLAEIRVYRSAHGLAYVPYETGGDWWINGVTESSHLLEDVSARATLSSIPILWPEKTADQANARAARIIGNRYPPALELVRHSSAVREVFGDIPEIRPAVGSNSYSSWMDSTSIFLTFRIIGARGEGAVIVQGSNCFDLQMVFNGIPLDDESSYVCP